MSYSVVLPNGQIVSGIDDAYTRDEAMAVLRQKIPQAFSSEVQETEPAKPKQSGFLAATKSGIESAAENFQTGIQTLLGDPKQAARESIERNKAIDERYEQPYDEEKIKKAYAEQGVIGAAKEVMSQLPATVAQQLPNMGAMLAGGYIGSIIGSVLGPVGTVGGATLGAKIGQWLASSGMQFGSDITRQAMAQQARGEEINPDLGKAALAASVQGVLDVASFGLFGGKAANRLFQVAEKGGKEAAEKVLVAEARAALEKTAQSGFAKTIGVGAAKGIGYEMPTEIAQQVLERWQAGLDLTSPDAIDEYRQTGVQTAMVGGVLGPFGSLADRSAARTQVEEDRVRKIVEANKAREAAEAARIASPEYQNSLEGIQAQKKQAIAERQRLKGELTQAGKEANAGNITPDALAEAQAAYDAAAENVKQLLEREINAKKSPEQYMVDSVAAAPFSKVSPTLEELNKKQRRGVSPVEEMPEPKRKAQQAAAPEMFAPGVEMPPPRKGESDVAVDIPDPTAFAPQYPTASAQDALMLSLTNPREYQMWLDQAQREREAGQFPGMGEPGQLPAKTEHMAPVFGINGNIVGYRPIAPEERAARPDYFELGQQMPAMEQQELGLPEPPPLEKEQPRTAIRLNDQRAASAMAVPKASPSDIDTWRQALPGMADSRPIEPAPDDGYWAQLDPGLNARDREIAERLRAKMPQAPADWAPGTQGELALPQTDEMLRDAVPLPFQVLPDNLASRNQVEVGQRSPTALINEAKENIAKSLENIRKTLAALKVPRARRALDPEQKARRPKISEAEERKLAMLYIEEQRKIVIQQSLREVIEARAAAGMPPLTPENSELMERQIKQLTEELIARGLAKPIKTPKPNQRFVYAKGALKTVEQAKKVQQAILQIREQLADIYRRRIFGRHKYVDWQEIGDEIDALVEREQGLSNKLTQFLAGPGRTVEIQRKLGWSGVWEGTANYGIDQNQRTYNPNFDPSGRSGIERALAENDKERLRHLRELQGGKPTEAYTETTEGRKPGAPVTVEVVDRQRPVDVGTTKGRIKGFGKTVVRPWTGAKSDNSAYAMLRPFGNFDAAFEVINEQIEQAKQEAVSSPPLRDITGATKPTGPSTRIPGEFTLGQKYDYSVPEQEQTEEQRVAERESNALEAEVTGQQGVLFGKGERGVGATTPGKFRSQLANFRRKAEAQAERLRRAINDMRELGRKLRVFNSEGAPAERDEVWITTRERSAGRWVRAEKPSPASEVGRASANLTHLRALLYDTDAQGLTLQQRLNKVAAQLADEKFGPYMQSVYNQFEAEYDSAVAFEKQTYADLVEMRMVLMRTALEDINSLPKEWRIKHAKDRRALQRILDKAVRMNPQIANLSLMHPGLRIEGLPKGKSIDEATRQVSEKARKEAIAEVLQDSQDSVPVLKLLSDYVSAINTLPETDIARAQERLYQWAQQAKRKAEAAYEAYSPVLQKLDALREQHETLTTEIRTLKGLIAKAEQELAAAAGRNKQFILNKLRSTRESLENVANEAARANKPLMQFAEKVKTIPPTIKPAGAGGGTQVIFREEEQGKGRKKKTVRVVEKWAPLPNAESLVDEADRAAEAAAAKEESTKGSGTKAMEASKDIKWMAKKGYEPPRRVPFHSGRGGQELSGGEKADWARTASMRAFEEETGQEGVLEKTREAAKARRAAVTKKEAADIGTIEKMDELEAFEPTGFDYTRDEDTRGEDAFRHNKGANSIKQEEADALGAKAVAAIPGLNYFPTVASVPEAVRATAKAQGARIENLQGGVLADGTAFIIGENHVDADDFNATVAHEMIGHYKLDRIMFGSKTGLELMKAMAAKYFGGKPNAAMELMYGLGFDGRTIQQILTDARRTADPNLTIMREIVARVAEMKPGTFTPRAKGFWATLAQNIKNMLRAFGFNFGKKMSPEDVLFLVKSAQEGTPRASPGEAAFRHMVNSPSNLNQVAERIYPTPPDYYKTFTQKGFGLALRTQYVDRFAPLVETAKRMAADMADSLKATQLVYYLRASDRINQFVGEVMTNGPVALTKTSDGKGYMFQSTKGANAKDIARVLRGEDSKLWGLYMALERAQKENVGLPKLLGDQAPAVTPDEQAEILAYGRNNAAYQTARNMYHQYNQGLVKLLVDTHFITQQTADKWLTGDYIPYYRVDDMGNVMLLREGDHPIKIGNIRDQKDIAALVGSDRKLNDPFINIARNTRLLVGAAIRNQAAKNTAFQLHEMGLGSMHSGAVRGRQEIGRNVIHFNNTENGRTVEKSFFIDTNNNARYADIPGDMIAKGMEGVPTQLPAILQWMQVPARFLRDLITLNPLYMVRQLTRDPMHAWVSTGVDTKSVLGAYKRVLNLMQHKDATGELLRERGLIGGQLLQGNDEDIRRILQQVQAGQGGVSSLISWLHDKGVAADATTRAALYDDFTKNKGMSELEATVATMDSVNFATRGMSSSVQAINMVVPFFNAQIQGLDSVWRALRGQMPFNERVQAQRKLVQRALMLTAGTVAYYALVSDEDWYQNQPESIRMANWLLPPLPGMKEPIKVPRPFEFGLMFAATPEAILIAGESDPKAKAVLKTWLNQLVNQVPGGSSLIMPAAVKPLIEVAANHSFFTGRPIVPSGLQDAPSDEQYTSNTTETAKLIGATEVARALNLSPLDVENIIKGYTAAIGYSTMQLLDAALSNTKVESASKPMSRTPLVGPLFADPDAGAIITRAYDAANRFDAEAKRFKSAKDQFRTEDAKKIAEEHGKEIVMSKYGAQFKSRMNEYTKMERQIQFAPNMTRQQKDEALTKLRAAKIATAKQFEEATAGY